MNSKELISVIVPIYNVDKYLPKCIDSIINQTYQNLEIILVDDGSTDKCSYICDDYKNIDPRIVVIHQDNKGLSYARNAGLDIAKGSLIGFIDSDDYIESTMYEELYKNMIETNSDISICNYYYVKDNRKTFNQMNMNKYVFYGNDKFANLDGRYRLQTIYAWNKLYKRKIFDTIRYPNSIIYEDVYIICDLLEKAHKVSYYSKPLYNYCYRKGSIDHSFNINHFNRIDSYNRVISFFEKKGYYNLSISEKNRNICRLLELFSKMKIYHINNKEIYDKYYNELVITSKELKWKESNKYVKRFKVFKRYYILLRSNALGLYYKIKSII